MQSQRYGNIQGFDTAWETTEIDLGKLGQQYGLDNYHDDDDDDDLVMGCKLALQQGLGGKNANLTALSVREINPMYDFVNVYNDIKEKIHTTEWIQPALTLDQLTTSKLLEGDVRGPYYHGPEDIDQRTRIVNEGAPIYEINNSSGIDRKIIALTGLQIPEKCNVSTIRLYRKGVKLIDQYFLSGHEKSTVSFNTVQFIGAHVKDDIYEIRFMFKRPNDIDMKTDHIKFLGFVVEPIGYNSMIEPEKIEKPNINQNVESQEMLARFKELKSEVGFLKKMISDSQTIAHLESVV